MFLQPVPKLFEPIKLQTQLLFPSLVTNISMFRLMTINENMTSAQQFTDVCTYIDLHLSFTSHNSLTYVSRQQA